METVLENVQAHTQENQIQNSDRLVLLSGRLGLQFTVHRIERVLEVLVVDMAENNKKGLRACKF